ncbi:MAG: mechanosensitive ion channel family protein [Hydrogenophaga sp.]|uniref:mechanosensitive ion channel domain-containing protein n=1 Tax=Hydrogenophaga sp. TaxID=1904254 RepID=UPI002610DA23|nr:mechanosensitive ion channel domain-containing protein [Hydrogenophaga sp.]MCV0437116.1 mechanosensitive ion channel family protein [Hydrogenophaga sp.]
MCHRRFIPPLLALRAGALTGWLVLASGVVPAQPLEELAPRSVIAPHQPRPPNALYLNNRHIATFRTTLLGDSPTDRVELARAALASALRTATVHAVTHSTTPGSVRFEVNGRTVFFLVAADAGTPRPEAALASAAFEVRQRLEKAVAEETELHDRRRIASDIAICLAASVLAGLLVRTALLIRRRIGERLLAALRSPQAPAGTIRLATTFSEHAHLTGGLLAHAVVWTVVLLILDTWITFVLLQFAWTRPWGELSSTWLMDLLRHFAHSAAAAVPGLVVAGFIFLIARMVSRANAAFMLRVERGHIALSWLDAHTALPTRRLCDAVLWLFALAMAYPYLPGSGTNAVKALSVMTGLMLSLGASSVVGQALSGIGLMYSRSLRVGQHVRIGDSEGTVVAMGMFTTRLHTDAGEEVCLPNKMIFGMPIHYLPTVLKHGLADPPDHAA